MNPTVKNFLLFSAFLLIPGCSAEIYPTHPNESSIERIENSEAKGLLQHLDSMNSGLGREVGRLPEFQGDIGEVEILALSRLTDLVTNESDAEKADLAYLLEMGRPNVRKYCTPLEAILWVLEKKVDKNVLRYSLVELLDKAWDYSDFRWEDYETVTDRLNAPRLINYYEKKRFQYGLRTDHAGDPRWLFQTNLGMCDDITWFTIICLRKGGYKASDFMAKKFNTDTYQDHHATLFKGKSGKFYVMDNGRPCKKGVVLLSEYLGRNS